MFPIIRSRIDARKFSRKLRESLTAPADSWQVGTDDEGQPMLSSGDIRIVLVRAHRGCSMQSMSTATTPRFRSRSSHTFVYAAGARCSGLSPTPAKTSRIRRRRNPAPVGHVRNRPPDHAQSGAPRGGPVPIGIRLGRIGHELKRTGNDSVAGD